MQNFYYSIPTEIYFGKGEISHLGEAVSKYGKNALLVYGGGSIKKLVSTTRPSGSSPPTALP